MSNFKNQPLKVILAVAESLLDTDFIYDNPWDEIDENYVLFEEKTAWLGVKVEFEDMEFIAAFMNINEPILESMKEGKMSKQEAITQVTIPKIKSFKLHYEIWGNATLTEQYSINWPSYDKNWVKDSLRAYYSDGTWSYYDGDYQGYETDNFEADNFDITDVDEIRESKKTILSKLVVENTKDLLENLDKETLIELRNLINQKLSSS